MDVSDATMEGTNPASALPREMVLASAGTGKTFRISSRIVGLLELGADPSEILASTFTRKAAGEILERVLGRMARACVDPKAAEELASHGVFDEARTPDAKQWCHLLERLTDRIHRIDVGTLDAFFVRVARNFSLELGLPTGWSIADEPTRLRLAGEALEDVLGMASDDEILELIRALVGSDAGRSVHADVLRRVGQLRHVLERIDPSAADPWSPFRSEEPEPSPKERASAAAEIRRIDPPSNKDGSPDKRWSDALESTAAAVEAGTWDAFLGSGLGAKVLDGDGMYWGKPISAGASQSVGAALELAARSLRREYAARARALGALALRFDEAFSRRQRKEGAFGFSDVTRMVGGTDPLGARADLWYRLDQRARHLLLDEFQDTSLDQWRALRPLADELLAGHADERACVIVADPKQSIYGWRGAEPELVHRVGRSYRLSEDRLSRSFRSSQVVLDFVNRVFLELPENPVWGDRETDRELARRWCADFEPHEAALDRSGRVRVAVGPREETMNSDSRPRMMEAVADRISAIRTRAPRSSVGILLRKRRNIPRVIAELRRRGLEASEEGGTRLTDSAAVTAILALLRLADHPGDTIASYHVAESPLGTVVGLNGHDDPAEIDRITRTIRRRLMSDGYGRTVDRWTTDLGGGRRLDARDLRRIRQLVELAFRWDELGATLRPADFARFVEGETVEDSAAAGIRVMTVHKAKGLEFDIVLLPELDVPLVGGGGIRSTVLPERDPDTGLIRRVFPYVHKKGRKLLPEVATAAGQARERELRDTLGVLYVGMTRARFHLELLLAADKQGEVTTSQTIARLVRETVGRVDEPIREGEILFSDGVEDWPVFESPEDEIADRGRRTSEAEVLAIRLAKTHRRDRTLTHTTPTESKREGEVHLGDILPLDPPERTHARRRGDLVHLWCRRLGWPGGKEGAPDERTDGLRSADGLPDDHVLLAAARRELPPESLKDEGEMRETLDRLRMWLARPEIREALERRSGDEELHREWAFAVRIEDEILRGSVDRLVLKRDTFGSVTRARVLDFKTDRVDDDPAKLAARVERYRPQVEAYKKAVARAYGLSEDAVEGALLFLQAGRAVRV